MFWIDCNLSLNASICAIFRKINSISLQLVFYEMLDFYTVASLKSDVVISNYHRQLSHFEESKLADRGDLVDERALGSRRASIFAQQSASRAKMLVCPTLIRKRQINYQWSFLSVHIFTILLIIAIFKVWFLKKIIFYISW